MKNRTKFGKRKTLSPIERQKPTRKLRLVSFPFDPLRFQRPLPHFEATSSIRDKMVPCTICKRYRFLPCVRGEHGHSPTFYLLKVHHWAMCRRLERINCPYPIPQRGTEVSRFPGTSGVLLSLGTADDFDTAICDNAQFCAILEHTTTDYHHVY